MNPLFSTITEQEFKENFEFIVTLVQRGGSFYIKTESGRLLALIPVNDPIAQTLMQNENVQDEIEEAIKDFNES